MIKVRSYDKKLRSYGTLNQRGVKNEKLRKRFKVLHSFTLLDEMNINNDMIAFKFGILCPSIVTNPITHIII